MKNPHAVQGAGASNGLASRHEVPSRTASQIQPTPADAISVFAPWAGPDDRPLRLRLHRAQTVATARATRSRHGRARILYWLAADLAGERTFARTSPDDLKDTLAALARLFLTAGWIERSEASDDER